METSLLSERIRAGILALSALLLTVSCSLLDNSQEARNRATLSPPTITFQALKVVTPFEPTRTLAPAIPAASSVVLSLVPTVATPANSTPENPDAAAATVAFQLTIENSVDTPMADTAPAIATAVPLHTSETVVATHVPGEINSLAGTPPPVELTTHAGASQPDVALSAETPSAANSPPAATAVTRSSQIYFTDCATGTDNNATIGILADMNFGGPMTLAAGDEIAVFSPDSTICAGSGVWTGQNLIISAWGDDGQSEMVEGLRPGQEMQFRLWDQSTGIEYVHAVVILAQGSGAYQVDGIYKVVGMTLLD